MITRPQTLVPQKRIDEFVSKLAKRGKKKDAIRALCLGERNFLKNAKYVKRGDKTETPVTLSIARRHNLLVKYRAAIRERFGEEHPALEYMRLTGETEIDGKAIAENDARNAGTRAGVIGQHVARRPLDADAHVERAIVVLEQVRDGAKPPALAIAAALAAVTGRRPIEILLTGVFAPVEKAEQGLFDASISPKRRWSLVFAGQAKTRGAESARNAPYEIPVLAEPGLLLHAFTTLRERYNCTGLTPEQVGNKAWKEMGVYAKRLFHDAVKPEHAPIRPKELRAAYATIVYEWYAPFATSWNAYTARVLGHSEMDLETSFSYDQFWPIGSKREYAQHIRAAARETLRMLQERRDRESDTTQAGYIDGKIAAVQERLEATA